MPPEYVNRREVRERVDRLLSEYGRDGVYVSVSREPPAEHSSFAELREYAAEGYLGGAYALTIRSDDDHPEFSATMPDDAATHGDRVLLGLGRYDEQWGPPGGGREAGETFEATAVREVEEEVGVTCEPTDVVAIRRVVVEHSETDDEIHLAYAVFEAAYVDGWIQVQETEVGGAAWFDAFPENLHPIVEPYASEWKPTTASTDAVESSTERSSTEESSTERSSPDEREA